MNLLWFFLGTVFGSSFGLVLMSLLQINRVHDYEEQIRLLESKLKNN